MHPFRSHTCRELRDEHVDSTVRLERMGPSLSAITAASFSSTCAITTA